MVPESGNNDLDAFLATHRPILADASIAPGDLIGDWRVTAYLGRGGSGEVYRVVHTTLGTAAALKVCVKRIDRDSARDEAVCARFRREAELLAENKHPAFPRFLGFGERDGRPWYVMELLECDPLPTKEKEIVQFLLAVVSGVRHLHAQGIIHRDIKPGNILWRIDRVDSPQPAASTQPVLIDLGLAKDLSAVRGHAGESLSIVDGQAVGVGTPRYAAPEQMSGDDVSPATDVYALGMLANDCFGGNPPRAWRRIIQRATAAIPVQRYDRVEAFARAIKLLRARYWIGGTFVAVLVAAAIFLWPFLTSVTSATKEPVNEESLWQSLCRNVTTNIVTWHSEMRRPDAVRRMSPGEFIMRANSPDCRPVVTSWAETNKTDVVMVNLDGQTVIFGEPLNLAAGREYWINGPGILDAQFSASSTATVRIANCTFRNRTKTRPSSAGIDYVLDGGAYLNFTELPSTESMKLEARAHIRSNGMSEGRNWWRIKGPEGIPELMAEELDSPAYSATMNTN